MVGIVTTEPSRRGTGPLNRTWLHRKRAHLLAVAREHVLTLGPVGGVGQLIAHSVAAIDAKS
jgi:hypothetical protein